MVLRTADGMIDRYRFERSINTVVRRRDTSAGGHTARVRVNSNRGRKPKSEYR